MISKFDIKNLQNVLKDFYSAVGIRISIFDSDYNPVVEYPETAPALCSMVRQSPEGKSGCRKCDIDACAKAKKNLKPHIYKCHIGITEAVTPIIISGGVIGYAILAHILPKEDYEREVKEVCTLCSRYRLEQTEILSAIKSIKTVSKEKIPAAVRMLDAVASYMYINQLASWQNEDIAKQINKFIEDNLNQNLDSQIMCKKFHISRTKLYQISVSTFGMGITQYITFKRIEKAKSLLTGSTKNISEISDYVGFSDYNHFCKVFKKITGTPPSKYSKNF